MLSFGFFVVLLQVDLEITGPCGQGENVTGDLSGDRGISIPCPLEHGSWGQRQAARVAWFLGWEMSGFQVFLLDKGFQCNCGFQHIVERGGLGA